LLDSGGRDEGKAVDTVATARRAGALALLDDGMISGSGSEGGLEGLLELLRAKAVAIT
jgi:hypothetical protein